MKQLLIAFDVDGTLRNNGGEPYGGGDTIIANERVRTLLIILACMKNTKIMVWSGGGELYCHQVTRALGIDKYVDVWADKRVIGCIQAQCGEVNPTHWHFAYDGPQPDIAIDDIQSFNLGAVNLIVKEK